MQPREKQIQQSLGAQPSLSCRSVLIADASFLRVQFTGFFLRSLSTLTDGKYRIGLCLGWFKESKPHNCTQTTFLSPQVAYLTTVRAVCPSGISHHLTHIPRVEIRWNHLGQLGFSRLGQTTVEVLSEKCAGICAGDIFSVLLPHTQIVRSNCANTEFCTGIFMCLFRCAICSPFTI